MAGCGKVCRDGARNLFIAGTYGLVKALFAVKSNVLRNKPAAGREWLAIQECYRDNAPARWLSTLSMGALLVLPQRYSVYQSGPEGSSQSRRRVCRDVAGRPPPNSGGPDLKSLHLLCFYSLLLL